MIFPSKHIRLSESIFGLGSFVLSRLSKPKSIDQLWTEFEKVNNTETFPAYHTFDNFILSLDFLFSLKLIGMSEKGEVHREAS